MSTETKALAESNKSLTASERFTKEVTRQYEGQTTAVAPMSAFQKQLVAGYFVMVDRAIKGAEEERLRKNASMKDSKYRNELAVNWNTVNLPALALDLVHYARLGLDMQQPNMLFPIPYKNSKTGQYDMTLMEGYNGVRYIAEKYALDKPKSVTVEVVYSTDHFKPIKKSVTNPIENYEFEIINPFDRGEIIGGFAYIAFEDSSKNELVIMSMKDIEKRKPAHASANFWGGATTKWENGKKVETEVEGWKDEMVRKTLIREAYSAKHIPRDPMKVDETYHYLETREVQYSQMEAQAEIEANANTIELDTTPPVEVVSDEQGEIIDVEATVITDDRLF